MTLRTNGQRIKNINFIALEKIQLFDFRVKYKEFNMHYYKFNIADYRKDTIHLNRTEHWIYRELIDLYYLDEKPIETETVIRRLHLGSESDKLALENVLKDFFFEHKGVYKHKRIEQEIKNYHEKSKTNKENGKLGGRPKSIDNRKKTESVSERLANEKQTVSENNPNHKPITINHKPLTINQENNIGASCDAPKAKKTRGSRLSENFELPNEWITFCSTERPDLNPLAIFQQFKDYWIAQTGTKATKADWFATWRNWVRNQKQTFSKQTQILEHNKNLATLWRPE